MNKPIRPRTQISNCHVKTILVYWRTSGSEQGLTRYVASQLVGNIAGMQI